MNENTYTFIGSCHAIEYNLADDADAKDPIAMLASVRVALLESLKTSDPQVDLQTALRAHVVTLLEAVERLRQNSKYQVLGQHSHRAHEQLLQYLRCYHGWRRPGTGFGGSASPQTEEAPKIKDFQRGGIFIF